MFCSHCGNEVNDEAVVCIHCGCAITQRKSNLKNGDASTQTEISELKRIAKVFMIIATFILAIFIVPLIWCLPMLRDYSNKIENGEPISSDFKVRILLFVSPIAGILLLLDKD